VRSSGSGTPSSDGLGGASNASVFSQSLSSMRSRHVSAFAHCGEAMIASWKGISVLTPPIWNSSSARSIRCVA
jgi:hypothetical protein